MENSTPTPLVVVTAAGVVLPLISSPSDLADSLGEKSDRAYREDCVAGRIPTLPRGQVIR